MFDLLRQLLDQIGVRACIDFSAQYLGGTRFVAEMTELYGIPEEASLGGAETMYPEFRDKIKDKFKLPAKCPKNCANAGAN